MIKSPKGYIAVKGSCVDCAFFNKGCPMEECRSPAGDIIFKPNAQQMSNAIRMINALPDQPSEAQYDRIEAFILKHKLPCWARADGDGYTIILKERAINDAYVVAVDVIDLTPYNVEVTCLV